MGVNYFTDEQVEQLRKNPYVKHVSNKAITYEDSFKEYFYLQYTSGYTPTQIFRMAGFDTNILKEKRIKGFYLRNKVLANSDDGFTDRRKGSVGRPKTKGLTPEEEIAKLKQKNKILSQENDFLKRVRFIKQETDLSSIKDQTPKQKFELINATYLSKDNKLSLATLCNLSGVSRSGYYSWLNNKNNEESYLNKKDKQDKQDFDLILTAYKFKGYDKGRRGIYMRLLHMGTVMNMKKISRLMKKFNLFCPIRKANPYRRMMKAIQSSNYAENLLERQFRAFGPGYVLLTDITYLFFSSKRIKAYLSTIKDAFTKQILAYKLSLSLEEDFVLDTVNDLFLNHKNDIHTDALIHSDQGAHYTAIAFIDLLKDKGIRQSMSRRGNCWDNAPQESFFGHMKDEIEDKVKLCESFEVLSKLIDDYIDYYNNDRYQYELAKLSPNEFLEYYKTGKYPLADIIPEPQDIKQQFERIKEDCLYQE